MSLNKYTNISIYILLLLSLVLNSKLIAKEDCTQKTLQFLNNNYGTDCKCSRIIMYISAPDNPETIADTVSVTYFDKSGRITQEITYSKESNGTTTYTRTFEYEKDRLKIITFKNFDLNEFTHEFSYDESGKLSGSSVGSAEARRITYEYLPDGCLKSEDGYTYFINIDDTLNPVTWRLYERNTYTYDKAMNIIKIENFLSSGIDSLQKWEPNLQTDMKYNNNNQLIEHTESRGGKVMTQTKHYYKGSKRIKTEISDIIDEDKVIYYKYE